MNVAGQKFTHHNLRMIEPSFGSPITDLILELEHLRRKQLGGTTQPGIFFQLKHIFHMLESLGSARIEGNNTTIAEYIETKIEKHDTNTPEGIREIQNIEKTMDFIEEYILEGRPLNRAFVSDIHKKTVEKLSPIKEGDYTPGEYRKQNVQITNSLHLPPDFLKINEYMEELFEFVNKNDRPKYDLIKVAIAHHRFVWIHPFTNGNGRTVRLFTYALLVKLRFNVAKGHERILNPTAIFCSNRDKYYNKLACADVGTEEGILEWCSYVLEGLKEEIEKIDRLADYTYLKKEILQPTLQYALDHQHITEMESKILKKALEKQTIQAADIKEFFPGKLGSEISRQIRRLINKNMLTPETKNGKKYFIRFDNSYLLRGIIKALSQRDFLPIKDDI